MCLALVVVCAFGASSSDAKRTIVPAVGPGCATFGNASDFVVFSDGQVNFSQAQGTSVVGRIAAAGNVELGDISVTPAAGDAAPTLITGGDFTGGRTGGSGGSLHGGVRHQGSYTVAPNFTVTGTVEQGQPPFSFDSEFAALEAQSSTWGAIHQTGGASVTLNPFSHALELTGTADGLNVFTVSASDLTAAAGIVINLTQPNASGLINITTNTSLTITPAYMNLSGSASPANLVWNLPSATGLAVTTPVAWKGLILAPEATVTAEHDPQLQGQLIAKTIPSGDWVLQRVAFTGCLPPTHGSPQLTSTASGSLSRAHGRHHLRRHRALTSATTIYDTATLSNGINPTGTLTFKLFGPDDATCSGTPAFTYTATVIGNGSYQSGTFDPTSAGTYRWVVAYSGDTNNDAAGPTACGVDTETVVVSPATPTLSSSAAGPASRLRTPTSNRGQRVAGGMALTAGQPIFDTAEIDGGMSPTGTLTFRLYGPDDPNCSGPHIFESVVAVHGNGPHNSDPFTPAAAGTYRWVVSYSGDANNHPAGPTECGIDSETVVISPAQPALSTVASHAVLIGGAISDSATLSGGSDPTGTITFHAYGPDDATCTGPAADTSTVPVHGNGVYDSHAFTPTAIGVYRWVASYSGDPFNLAASPTACGDPAEAVVVSPLPKAHTAISTTAAGGAPAGSPIDDVAHLTDGNDPTGTITFRVYGPHDTDCTGPPAGSSTVTVSGNGDHHSEPFTPTLAGTYHWVAEYSGDEHNHSAGPTACDDHGESVVVSQADPGIHTVALAVVPIGATIGDTAVLAGGSDPRGTITFRLYGPDNHNCSGSPVFTAHQIVVGNGVYRSPRFDPLHTGTYLWTAAYSGDANNHAVATHCDDMGERTMVLPRHVLLATSASPPAYLRKGPRVQPAGQTIYDSAILQLGFRPTGEVTFELFGPDNSACSGSPIFTSATEVNGNGIYRSERFTPTASGIYRWLAVYSGDANNRRTGPTGCGDPREHVHVTVPADTQLTTTASPSVNLGAPVHDTAHLSGGSHPKGTITFRLYGPDDIGCSNPPAFTSTVGVDGNGDYSPPSFVPVVAGAYQWVASYSGDHANHPAGPTACNDSAETVAVRSEHVPPAMPTLTTTASGPSQPGEPVHDTAHLSGGVDPRGVITFSLFGPDDSACSAPPVFISTVAVTGAGDYDSAPFLISVPGTYRWVATYSGDSLNAAAGPTKCGDPAEMLSVNAPLPPTPNPGPNVPQPPPPNPPPPAPPKPAPPKPKPAPPNSKPKPTPPKPKPKPPHSKPKPPHSKPNNGSPKPKPAPPKPKPPRHKPKPPRVTG